MRLSAAQERYHLNATVIAASRLIFDTLSNDVTLVHRLGDIAATTSGGTPDRQIVSYFGGDIPWIKSGELNDDMIQQAAEFITEEGLHHSSAKVFPKGSLLVALYGATVGKTGILGLDAATNQAVCMISPRSNNVVTRYLYWFLRYKRPDFLNNSFGGAQPNISQKHLQDTPTPLPPPDIQRAICAFLDGVEMRRVSRDSTDLVELPYPLHDVKRIVARIEALAARIEQARGLRREAAELTDALIRSVMRDAFGANQEMQHVTTLEAACAAIIDNLHSNPVYAESGIPCVRSPDVGWGTLDLGHALRTGEDEYRRRTVRGEPRPGDIVLVREGGGTGKAAIVEEGQHFSLGQRVMMIRPNCEVVMPKYFLYQLLSPAVYDEQIAPMSKGSASPHLNIGALRKFRFQLPPMSQQEQAVACLDELYKRKRELELQQSEVAAELDALLLSVLDRAFRGEL